MYTVLEQALHSVKQVPLACLPTPLERMARLEQALGYSDAIYIKRDDLTRLGPGGNKLRSLEFLLGEALSQEADIIVAAGPVQSNLCTLTAAACARLGLRCILVHNGEKPAHREGNVLLNHLLGAESKYLGNISSQERTDYVCALMRSLSLAHHPYFIRNGATSGCGSLGYIKAIPELCRQTESLGISGLTIFVPGGNGGMASGLIYGNVLCRSPFHIVVVSVENDRDTLAAAIRRTIAEAEALLGLPLPCELDNACTITDQYRGSGWGINTDQSSRLITEFAQAEGILIENVYNSKVLVGMYDYLRSHRVNGPVCYLHTGGFGSLFSQY